MAIDEAKASVNAEGFECESEHDALQWAYFTETHFALNNL